MRIWYDYGQRLLVQQKGIRSEITVLGEFNIIEQTSPSAKKDFRLFT